jgi:uncharacterized protein YgiM (DUF1202 family)
MNGSLKSLQLFIGILTGLLGLGAIAGGVGYYVFITQIGTRPPKPVFAEEREGSSAKAALANAPVVEPELTEIEKLNYDAKVTSPQGLSLRKEPSPESEKLGSVDFEAKVAIVKTSDDGVWALIQPESDSIQGWVKAANIDKTTGTDNQAEATPKQGAKAAEEEVKPRRRRKPAAESEAEATPNRRRRVKVNPDESPANNNEEAAPKRKRKVKVTPEPLPNQESAPDPEPSSEPEKTN